MKTNDRKMSGIKMTAGICAVLFFALPAQSVEAQAERPSWVRSVPPATDTAVFFTGEGTGGTKAASKEKAVADADMQIAGYMYKFISNEYSEKLTYMRSMDKTLQDTEHTESASQTYTELVVSGIRASAAEHTEYSGRVYTTWVLSSVNPRDIVTQKEAFEKKISENYGALFVNKTTLSEALHAYAAVYDALDKNPLHRMLAYHDGENGRALLYYHCMTQMNALAAGMTFTVPAQVKIRRGNGLVINIPVKSSFAGPANMGNLAGTLRISGTNNTAEQINGQINRNGILSFSVPASLLQAGSYRAEVSLPFDGISPAIRQNPAAHFSVEVGQASAHLEFRGGYGFTGKEKETFFNALQSGLAEYKIPLTLVTEPDGGAYKLIVSADNFLLDHSLVRWQLPGLSVSFAVNNEELHSEHFTVTETSREHLVFRTVTLIKERASLYKKIGETVNHR